MSFFLILFDWLVRFRKDQVYIKRRYLAQISKKHENFEKVLIYSQRMVILLFNAAVRGISAFPKKKFIPFVDIEKKPGPFDASKFFISDEALFLRS